MSRDELKISSLWTGVRLTLDDEKVSIDANEFAGSIVSCKKKISNFRTTVESVDRPQHVRSADEIPFFEASRRKVPTILLSYKFHLRDRSTCVEEESDFPFPRIILCRVVIAKEDRVCSAS